MTVFESLLMAHLAGDWLLQTEWQALNKTQSWRAMWSHVLVYHVLVLAVLGLKLGFRDPSIYVVVALLAISHAILDRVWPVQWLIKTLRIGVTRSPDRWLTIIVDQSIHIILLGVATIYLTH